MPHRDVSNHFFSYNLHLLTQVFCYKSCAIGRSSHKQGSAVTRVARPYTEGNTNHTCVAIQGIDSRGQEETWYAVLYGLLTFDSSFLLDKGTLLFLKIIMKVSKLMTEIMTSQSIKWLMLNTSNR